MTSTLAERLHAAFVEASGWTEAPTFAAWPDKGAAWYTLASERATFLEPPDVREPYEHELRTPISPRFKGDVKVVETLPTSLHIRPKVAGDLCLPECAMGNLMFTTAVHSKIYGVDFKMFDERVDAVDAELGTYLLAAATGVNAGTKMEARARVLMPDVPEEYIDCDWDLVAYAMLVVDEGDRSIVHCRTPGMGPLTIGPYRVRHKRIHADVSSESNEWRARLAVLADMTGKGVSEIEMARVEDIVRAWTAFAILKKNATETALLIFLSQSSFTSTADGGQVTSTTGPTPDSGGQSTSLSTSGN